MADLRSQILSARKPVQPGDFSKVPPASGRTLSIAPKSNSPFGIYDNKKDSTKQRPQHRAHLWADCLLREKAGRNERVILAVRDAARQAVKLGKNPAIDEIYVADSIRKGWNLKPDQLSKGLSALERQGCIRLTRERKRGPHARFVLVQYAQECPVKELGHSSCH